MKWIAGVVIWILAWEVYSYVGGEEKIVVLAGWLLVALLISTACIIGYLVRIIDLLEKNSDNERAAKERPAHTPALVTPMAVPAPAAAPLPVPGAPAPVRIGIPVVSKFPPPGSPYEPDPYATMQGNAPPGAGTPTSPGAPGPKKATVRIGMPPKPDSKQTIKISMPGSGGASAPPGGAAPPTARAPAPVAPAPAPVAPAPVAPAPAPVVAPPTVAPEADPYADIERAVSKPLPQATQDERDADNERGMKKPPKLPRAVDARWDARPARPMAVGTYEYRDDKGTITTSVLLANGVCEAYTNGKKHGGDIKWKIANGELRIFDETGFIGVSVINKDNSFSMIALIEDGERTDFPKEIQPTYKKIK
jgi:hypothetical protein